MTTKISYEVQHMPKWPDKQKWKEIYSGENKSHAHNIARGTVTNNPKIPVRILEAMFKDGLQIGKPKEYGVNPPIWSGKKEMPEKGAEIFLRGYLDMDDLSHL